MGFQIKNQKKPRTVNTINRKEAVHARGGGKTKKNYRRNHQKKRKRLPMGWLEIWFMIKHYGVL